MSNKFRPWVAAVALGAMGPVWASGTGLVISQVFGGGGNTGAPYQNDFVELRNAGATAVSLAGLSIQYGSSAGDFGSGNAPVALTNVSLAPGQYYLVQLGAGAGNGVPLPAPDVSGGTAMSSSSGKVALVTGTSALACGATANPCNASKLAQIVDLVGYGTATFYEGTSAAPGLSNTTAALRAAAGCTDSDVNGADFTAAAPTPRNSSTAYTVCAGGGGGGEPSLSIPQIQGSGATSPVAGQRVRTGGVVTLLTNVGFFMQDLTGDGNPATSDGIYVYLGSAPTVHVGDLVSLTAMVTEYNTGAASNADTAAHPLTELTAVSGLSTTGTGYSITPVSVTLPELTNDDLERVEGMLVTLTGPLTVSQNYFQGRYGQVTLSYGGRMEVPTNRYRPGSAQALALADLNARSRIILDDATSQQNPNPTPYMAADDTLRAGDTVASVTGVVDYGLATSSNTGFGDYRIQPRSVGTITRANARPGSAPKLGGNLRVASFNVLNFFTTFTDGTDAWGRTGQGCTLGGQTAAANCRGADQLAEFVRQRTKIVEALALLDADVVGLMEMQNNGSTAVQHLVDTLNARVGAGTYAVVPDPASGTGSDAIKVAMIYKPARLARVGSALGDSDAVHSRPPLAQAFAAPNGERIAVVVNHLKSKGSCPSAGDGDYAGNFDSGDGQGCWNAKRVAQAQRMLAWLPTVSAVAPRVMMLGDFNAYAQEDPIVALTGGGLVDQIARSEAFGYSYVFDGAAGRLDHLLASPAMSDIVTRAAEWHINADEPSVIDYNQEFKQPVCASCGPDYYSATPYRSSDHDPAVVGLRLEKLITGTSGRDTLAGSAGDDRFIGGAGADTLTGGAGINTYQYDSVRDAGDLVTDFVPGRDRIDLSRLLAAAGWAGSDPVAEGWVRVIDDAQGRAAIQVDADGPSGGAAMRTLVTLAGVSSGQLQLSHDLVARQTTDTQRLKKAAKRIQ